MTLQDDVARAFVQDGGLRTIVKELVREDLLDFDLEDPSGEGWPDVSATTSNHRLRFEIKTHVKVLRVGEIHEYDVGGTLRQLKKYKRSRPTDTVSVVIPQLDAESWAPIYANAGFATVAWSGKRTVRCPRCRTEYTPELVASNRCDKPACGYEGLFEQISLNPTQFVLLTAYPPRERKWEKEEGDLGKLLLLLREEIDVMEQVFHELDSDKLPYIPIDSWEVAKSSGLLFQVKPIQFRAMRNLFIHCEHYNRQYEELIGTTYGSQGAYLAALQPVKKLVDVIREQITLVRDLMGWTLKT